MARMTTEPQKEDKYNGVDCQGIRQYTKAMNEVAKNVYVTGSIVADLIKDPKLWLKDHEEMPVRYVGGIHNISNNDKKNWASDLGEPLRVVETATGREEVWFSPDASRSPAYVSLDNEGNLTSHMKWNRSQPTLIQDVKQSDARDGVDFLVEFSMWYHGDVLHRVPDKNDLVTPAVLSSKMQTAVWDDEYIRGIGFSLYREFWTEGEWESTDIGAMKLIFVNDKLNTPEIQNKAGEWIYEHCDGGFFPFTDQLFGEEDEEFMFLLDICSQG